MHNSLYYSDAINACLAYTGVNFKPDPKIHPDLQVVHGHLYEAFTQAQLPDLQLNYKAWLNHACFYSSGWYECGVATAYVTRTKNYLTIAFRGTDGIVDMKDYLALKNHYKLFKPLLEAVFDYVKLHQLQIRAVGHSLGGSMVEYFIEEYGHLPQIKGTTFGSPGSSAKYRGKNITNFYHLDDVIPYLGKTIYKQHGKRIEIRKPYMHPISSHLAEEYVASIEEIPTGSITESITAQTVKTKKRLFHDYESKQLDSVHLTYNFKIPRPIKSILKKINIFK